MTAKNPKAAAFLQALSSPPSPPAHAVAAASDEPKARQRASTRVGLKHIGGYFERDDVEKFAILRARLGLDNSELIRLAVDDLYRKHEAKRAFGEG